MDRLIYNGELKVTPSFSDEEVNFLNTWQEVLCKNFLKAYGLKDKSRASKYYENIKNFIGLPLDESQMWVLSYSFNPLIKFTKNSIIINGEHEKGQLRDALLIYQYFFFAKEPFMKKCIPDLKFLQEHTFDGIIQAEKFHYKTGHTQWCYIAEKSEISSVNAKTIEEYLENPKKYPKDEKIDKSWERINKYYPENSPLMRYINLNIKLETKNDKTKKVKI